MNVARPPRDCSIGFSFGPLARTSTPAAVFCIAERTRAWDNALGRLEHEMDSLGLRDSGRWVPKLSARGRPIVSQGKDVDAGRVEGQMVYDCVARQP
jgi:hypothetical protein